MITLPRRPWLAAVLSLVVPGLGHLYCGRPLRGLALLLLSVAFGPAAWIAALPPPAGAKLALLLASVAAIPVAVLLGAADAFRIARRAAPREGARRGRGAGLYAAWAVVGLCALAAPLVVRHQAMEAFRIATGSMEPTLAQGDLVLASKLDSARTPLGRGDLIVFLESGRAYVKRVVALAGDAVSIQDGRVLVNDAAASLPATTVPAGHIFVLGDDMACSRDSRAFGPVPSDRVIGVVLYRLSPPRAGPFDGP